MKSQGNTNGNVAYNLAVGPRGGRIGLSYTRGAIRIVSGPYVPLDIDGTSETAAINATQPIFGNTEWMLLLNGPLSRVTSLSDQSDICATAESITIFPPSRP